MSDLAVSEPLDAPGALSQALSKNGIAIDSTTLEQFRDFVESADELGAQITREIEIDITNGIGRFEASYPTFWLTVNATLQIIAPDNKDRWQVVARDTYNDKTIWSGVMTYRTPVSTTYKTASRIDLEVAARNQTEPYTGKLRAQVTVKL